MLSTYDEKLAQLIFKSYVRNHTWQVPTLETKWSLAFFDELVGKDDARLRYIPASEREFWTPQKNFFARFLEKNYLEGLSAERGRFRAFLLASLKHFLANEWDKSQRQKRGGGVTPLSLD